jgi:hypothetical protein
MKEVTVNEHTIAAIAAISTFGTIAWIAWLGTNAIRRSKMAKAQAEVQSKLLDKFGSSQELLEYMQTDAGQRFAQMESEPVVTKSPQARILGSIKVGTILSFLGIGLMILYAVFNEYPALGFGIISLAIGLGFLVSSGVSYKLSKSWGLFDGEGVGPPRSE